MFGDWLTRFARTWFRPSRPARRRPARRPGTSPTPTRRPRLAAEFLEDRWVPAIVAALNGPGTTVTFYEPTGYAENDRVGLRVDTATGKLEWQANGGGWSHDLDSFLAGDQTASASGLNIVVAP